MLKLYLDDSGSDDKSVGGCVATVASWNALESAWRHVLDEFHVEWFHAVDFEAAPGHGRNEHRECGFPPMSDSERRAFRLKLVETLQSHIGIPLTGPVGGNGARWGGYLC